MPYVYKQLRHSKEGSRWHLYLLRSLWRDAWHWNRYRDAHQSWQAARRHRKVRRNAKAPSR